MCTGEQGLSGCGNDASEITKHELAQCVGWVGGVAHTCRGTNHSEVVGVEITLRETHRDWIVRGK